MNWQALVTDNEKQKCMSKLDEIANIVMANAIDLKTNIGLMGGKAGASLFMFYFSRLVQDEKYGEYGYQLLTEIFDTINDSFNYHTFAGGLAGVGWTVELLAQNDFIDADTADVLADLDPYLFKTMMKDIEDKNYDFLHGAIGNGTYFLSRLNQPNTRNYLEQLVESLDKISITEAPGLIKWETELDHETKTRGYNLSLSHGMASIIVFLGKCVEKGICKERSNRLLEGAVGYMLAQRLDIHQHESYFPSWVGKDYPPAPSRMAWCYGDLGIGMALRQAGRDSARPEWERIGEEVLLHSTHRRGAKENALIDAGLCHGTAGLTHIYSRIFNETQNPAFKETALYWLDQMYQMAVHTDGYAGFKAWHTLEHGGWVSELGLLEGVSGIGLMLLSLISPIEPTWDRCLFLS